MSKKKRRNQEQLSSESIITNSTEAVRSIEPLQSSKSNQVGNLKRNWWMIALIAFLSIGALGATLKYLDEDAKRELARRAENKGNLNNTENQSFLSSINPFLPTPTPTPTPQLSKEYLYAGEKLLAVEDANANAAPPADLAVWRPSTGTWWVMGGTGSQQTSQQWGVSTDLPRPGDYDGDGKTDFCVYRVDNTAQTATWYIMKSSDNSYTQFQYGLHTDKAAPADFDGDGKTDIAVFRQSTGTWYVYQSSNSSSLSMSFGSSSDEPIPADFDGDGKADVSVWRSSNATFYSYNSSNAQTITTPYGSSADKPVCGDYDGDGRADLAVWRSSNTTWYYKKSSDGTSNSMQWGTGTDIPVQNDYDGDGKVDMALWRAVNSGNNDVGRWYIYQSSNGQIRQEQWGIAGDFPVPALYRR